MALFEHLEHQFFRILNWLLAPADTLFASRNNAPDAVGPVFVIGPPRSGTTILYQLLIHSFDFAYINNLVGHLYRCPNLGLRLSYLLGLNAESITFESTHGVTTGLAGPNEFGLFWYRWFPKTPHYADELTLNSEAKNAIRSTVDAMRTHAGRPLLFKNTVHSVRIRALRHLFPKALFIVCERDPVYTGQSIYRIRTNRSRKEAWWSARPRELDRLLDMPLIEQCVYQVYYLTKQIETDSRSVHYDKFFRLSYKRLCEDTEREMSQVQTWLKRHGVQIQRRSVPLPQLRANDKKTLSDEDFEQIRSLVETLWPE